MQYKIQDFCKLDKQNKNKQIKNKNIIFFMVGQVDELRSMPNGVLLCHSLAKLISVYGYTVHLSKHLSLNIFRRSNLPDYPENLHAK